MGICGGVLLLLSKNNSTPSLDCFCSWSLREGFQDSCWNRKEDWLKNFPFACSVADIDVEMESLWSWRNAAKKAANSATTLLNLGLHKQIVNRVLEPFTYIDVVVTATDYANWFALRLDKDAQPEKNTANINQNQAHPVAAKLGRAIGE